MRIGFYSNWYKPIVNGVVRSMDVFRDELARQGHEVHIFAPEAPGYVDQEPHVWRYRALQIRYPVSLPMAIPFSPAHTRHLRALGLDVLHSQHPVLLGREALRQARRCHIPLVFTYHSHYDNYAPYVPLHARVFTSLTHEVVGRYLTQCQRIIAPTPSIRAILADSYPEVLPRVAVLPTPIDLTAYAHLDPEPIRAQYGLRDRFTFIVVSRLAPEKGLRELLGAFAQVARRHAEACLLVVGDGPQRGELEEEAAALGLGKRALFVGQVPFAEVPHYLAAADVFAYASLCETQGLVLVEALAAGLPVVAMRAVGSQDVIHHDQDGLLTAPTERALAEGMGALMADAALRRRLAEEARRTAVRYAVPDVARRLVEIYQEAIAD